VSPSPEWEETPEAESAAFQPLSLARSTSRASAQRLTNKQLDDVRDRSCTEQVLSSRPQLHVTAFRAGTFSLG
jgi:hypothetical protein